ncbi:MAG: hypothetical protein ACK40X_07775 [Armatimonadota bacterium]
MSLKELILALRFINLVRAVYVGILRLKYGQVGEKVQFSGVRLKVDGVLVEIRGEIVRIE